MRAGSRRGLDQATNKTTRRATTAVADAHALMLGAARAALEIAQLHRAGMGVGETIHGQRLQKSEEHTSELQSLMRISYAVFCLKKKNKKNKKTAQDNIYIVKHTSYYIPIRR